MGIPGLLKEIGKGERVALTKLAIEHLERTNRPLRIAIDAAIWNFQHQAGQGGKNPALRTLFFRLLRLLALPIHPVFVYDGKNKPLTKRGKTVSRYGTCVPNELSKNLVARFQFPYHTAPGEAEAECAFLQRNGIVDAVMSQDVDAIMFGSTLTLRDWSKEGTKGNKAPTHVNVLDQVKIQETTGLDTAGMILVALLSGGDYHEGISGFGPGLSCSIAKAGFGSEMIELVQRNDESGLREWRERLQYELETNESGYFAKRHKTVHIPDEFPDRTILSYYLEPAVSKKDDLEKLEARWTQWWDQDINIPALRDYTGMTFDWLYKGGARKFIRCLAQPLFQHGLKTHKANSSEFCSKTISDRRKHFINDGVPELRFSAVPADVVSIDLDAEEDNPEFADLDGEVEDDQAVDTEDNRRTASPDITEGPSNQSGRRKRPPWDPHTAEKWWIPETLLKLGLPALVETWEQERRDIRADPVKFATRKCRQPTKLNKQIDRSMKIGALKEFLPVAKTHGQRSTPSASHTQALDTKTSEVYVPNHTNANTSAGVSSQEFTLVERLLSSQSSWQPQHQVCGKRSASPAYSKSPAKREDIEVSFPVAKSIEPHIMQTTSYENAISGTSDPEVPTTVTQRKRRQPNKATAIAAIVVEDDDVTFIGVNKLPPPISSFFGSNAGKKVNDNSSPGTRLTHDSTSKVLARGADISSSGRRGRTEPAPRSSLPGSWKELAATPQRNSRISIVDLTDI